MKAMRHRRARSRQQGVTLIVGLILLILITLMVTTAFTLNTSNLKSVGNMQFRNEAIAAANMATETVIGTSFPAGFTSVPPAQTITFDVNHDGTPDYSVAIAIPTCVQVSAVAGEASAGTCGGFRGLGVSGCTATNYSTLWNIDATVTDAVSGAQVSLTQGFRQELTESQKNSVCP